MKKDLSVEEWREELARGLEFRRQFGVEDSWSDLEALYYGVRKSDAKSAGPNLIMSTGDSLLSDLCVPTPAIVVKARQNVSIDHVRVLESVDNEFLEDLRIEEEVEASTLHAFLWGRGIIKCGYDSEFGWTPKDTMREGDFPLGLSLSQFDSKGNLIEYDANVRPGMPWVRAVLPHDIVVPWGVRRLRESPWIAHRVVRHIDDVKADDKYSKTRDLEPVMSMEDFVQSYNTVQKRYRSGQEWVSKTSSSEVSGHAEYVELWEIHDRRTGKVKVIATGHDKFLRDDDNILGGNGLPFVEVGFVPATRSFWVTPDAYYLRYHQAELTDIAIQSGKQRRISVLKFLYDKGAIESSELEKALSSEVGIAAAVNEGRDMSKAVMSLTFPNNNLALQQDAEYIRRNARELVGLSRNQMGEFESAGRRTATEAGIVSRASDKRMGRRENTIVRTHKEIFKILNGMVFRFWTTPRWTKIVGQDGAESFVRFVGTQLKGDYSYDITFTEEGGFSMTNRRQTAVNLYSMLAQDPQVDQTRLKLLLSKAFNDPEVSEFLQAAPPPVANFNGGLANANLPIPVQGMRQGGGRVPSQGGGQG